MSVIFVNYMLKPRIFGELDFDVDWYGNQIAKGFVFKLLTCVQRSSAINGKPQPKSRMELIQKHTLGSDIAQRSFMSASDHHDACTRASAIVAICGMAGER